MGFMEPIYTNMGWNDRTDQSQDRYARRIFKTGLCRPKVRNNHDFIARPGFKHCSLCNQVKELHVSSKPG